MYLKKGNADGVNGWFSEIFLKSYTLPDLEFHSLNVFSWSKSSRSTNERGVPDLRSDSIFMKIIIVC